MTHLRYGHNPYRFGTSPYIVSESGRYDKLLFQRLHSCTSGFINGIIPDIIPPRVAEKRKKTHRAISACRLTSLQQRHLTEGDQRQSLRREEGAMRAFSPARTMLSVVADCTDRGQLCLQVPPTRTVLKGAPRFRSASPHTHEGGLKGRADGNSQTRLFN